MTKICSILLSIILILSVSAFAQGTQPPGSGTAIDPYQVSTLDHLEWIGLNSSSWDKEFIQMADIDASSTVTWNSGEGFLPIGNNTTAFSGIYDGQGYTIDALFIDRSTSDNIGFFGYTYAASILDLGITNVSFLGKSFVGGLVGYSDNTDINRTYTSGDVASGDANSIAGGLIGRVDEYCSISQSYSSCAVVGEDMVGGLIGYGAGQHLSINQCYSLGNVEGSAYVGAFIGRYSGHFAYGVARLKDCYSLGDVTRKSGSTDVNIGAFCGEHEYGSIWNSYTYGSVYYDGATDPTDKGFSGVLGGTVGTFNCYFDREVSNQTSANGADAKTTAEMKDFPTYTAWSFVGASGNTGTWNMHLLLNNGYPYLIYQTEGVAPSGSGTGGDPYIIASLDNLLWLSTYSAAWDKEYQQAIDIDASATSTWNDDGTKAYLGFSPIGNSHTNFTGVYDGDGFVIDGLYIKRDTSDHIGLFGYTNGASINDIGITNASITGDQYVGALIGSQRDSDLSGSHSSGTITSLSTSGVGDVGGLVGSCFYYSSMHECYSTCNVDGFNMVGGLIGYGAGIHLSIEQCYSTGDVEGNAYVGGFIGKYNGHFAYGVARLKDCYSLGDVTRKSGSIDVNIGAFCGEHEYGAIFNSYTIGNVYYDGATDPTDKGFSGVLGSTVGTFNCYFDSDISNQTTGTGASAKTSAEMKTIGTYTGWSFVPNGGTVWNIGSAFNDGYPYLDYQIGLLQPPGTGTPSDPYMISTLDHLLWLSADSSVWDKHFNQVTDIDASSTSSWNGFMGFSPIGNTTTPFSGVYDGQGFVISDLYIFSSSDYIGFFSITENAEIINLGLSDVDITGKENVGGLIGLSNYNTIITDCFVSGEITGDKYVGGMAGKASFNEIYRSFTECIVVSNDVGAGVIGYNNRTKAYESYSTGSVSGPGSGGFSGLCIFGENYNSYSLCDITGDYSGGFNANSTYATFRNCFSAGSVNGTNCGGFNADKYHGGSFGCFWDIQATGQTTSAGGTGKTTAEMKILATFTSAGWDFIGESANGTDDYWNINGITNEGYPFLSYEISSWTAGAGTSDWFTGANWYNNSIPSADDNVSIANTTYMPSISGTTVAECNDLIISSSASVTIEDNGKLTVNGDVTNNGIINMESNSYGDASLIVKGNLLLAGNFEMDRHISGHPLGWHFLSSPVNAYAISGSTFEPLVNEGLFAWDESVNDYPWINYKNTTSAPTFTSINGGDYLNPGQGYLVAYNGTNVTKTFTGDMNVGNVNVLLKNSTTKAWTYQEGWNFMGNPYSSTILWSLADRSFFQDDYAYIYHPNKPGGEGYIEVDGSSTNAFIAPNQGFFVIAKQSSNNVDFTFTNAMQVHGGDFLKNTDKEEDKIVVRLTGNTYYDETIIGIKPQSTSERDRKDAVKMYSFNLDIPQLYSRSTNNADLSVNCIPEIDASTTIPIGIQIPTQGSYKLSIEEASTELMDNGIYLEDKLAQNWYKLSEGDYDFTSAEGEVPGRFVLHFAAQDIDDNKLTNDKLHVWSNNRTIYISNPANLKGEISVFSIYGQNILQARLNGDSQQELMIDATSAYYIVRIVTEESVISSKVYLK